MPGGRWNGKRPKKRNRSKDSTRARSVAAKLNGAELLSVAGSRSASSTRQHTTGIAVDQAQRGRDAAGRSREGRCVRG